MRDVFINVRYLAFYIVLILFPNRLVISDLRAWNKAFYGSKGEKHSLAFFLYKLPEFRNLFYHRYKERKILVGLLKIFAPPMNTFYIGNSAKLGEGIIFYHPFCTYLNCISIGDNCRIRNGTTFGNKSDDNNLRPMIGNNVNVGVNVTIIGDIKIGDNAIIGAGAIVTKSFPGDSIIAGNPAKIIKLKKSMKSCQKSI